MKPVILSGSWIINASASRVFQIFTDFENANKYFPLVAGTLKIINRKGNHLTIKALSKTFGISFNVLMETDIIPNKGFKSINTSILAIENESFLIEEVGNKTKILYRNEVEIKNNFLKIFAKLLIGKPALMFWKYAYIDRLEKLANEI